MNGAVSKDYFGLSNGLLASNHEQQAIKNVAGSPAKNFRSQYLFALFENEKVNDHRMTMEELEGTLPNGFHDALLLYLRVDYETDVCTLGLKVDLEQSGRRAEITLSGLSYCIVEVPHLSSALLPGSVRLSGNETTDSVLPAFHSLRTRVRPESFFYSFFVSSWNSFIHLAALEAELTWLDDLSLAPRRGE